MARVPRQKRSGPVAEARHAPQDRGSFVVRPSDSVPPGVVANPLEQRVGGGVQVDDGDDGDDLLDVLRLADVARQSVQYDQIRLAHVTPSQEVAKEHGGDRELVVLEQRARLECAANDRHVRIGQRDRSQPALRHPAKVRPEVEVVAAPPPPPDALEVLTQRALADTRRPEEQNGFRQRAVFFFAQKRT